MSIWSTDRQIAALVMSSEKARVINGRTFDQDFDRWHTIVPNWFTGGELNRLLRLSLDQGRGLGR